MSLAETQESVLHEVVFVAGAGHSGSTLLGLMLGAHPAVFYAGEARKSLFLGDERKPLKKRVCKLCGERCPIWGDLRIPEGGDLYARLAERTGKSVIVDSTKNVEWLEARIAALVAAGTSRRMILLARDGRAVVCSRMRKYPERSAREHAADWAAQMRASEALAARFPGEVLRARYEEIASEPEREARRIAAWLGLSYEPAMIAPWTSEQHPLGGNNGTQFLLARERGALAGSGGGGVVGLTDKTRAHYAEHPPAIVLDLRWTREMSAEARAAFDEVAGEVNAAYAWDEERA